MFKLQLKFKPGAIVGLYDNENVARIVQVLEVRTNGKKVIYDVEDKSKLGPCREEIEESKMELEALRFDDEIKARMYKLTYMERN